MHIAVCDDNVIDRNQMERLLKRESESRAKDSIQIYTDSFGNAVALLSNPMQYDLFYIDMCKTEGITGHKVVKSLLAKGIKAPIVMCCSDIDYRTETYPENVSFLNKPIKPDELSASIDQALAIQSKAVPLIELRLDSGETIYVTEPEICFITVSGRNLLVAMSEKRSALINTNLENFYPQIESFPAFAFANNKTIINVRYIADLGTHTARLIDGTNVKIQRNCMHDVEKAYLEYTYHYF